MTNERPLKGPWKDTVLAGGKVPEDKKLGAGATTEASKEGGSKYEYIPPSRDYDYAIIRITNLSESTYEADLENLVNPFGPVCKLYLIKDKITRLCEGYGYVHYKFRSDAGRALRTLNGYCFNNLILSVDWATPPSN